MLLHIRHHGSQSRYHKGHYEDTRLTRTAPSSPDIKVTKLSLDKAGEFGEVLPKYASQAVFISTLVIVVLVLLLVLDLDAAITGMNIRRVVDLSTFRIEMPM